MQNEDAIEFWAVKLAEAVDPGEVDLAPLMATAYVHGGRDRLEMFHQASSGTLGGFGGGTLVLFPWILQAIAVAAPLLTSLFTSGALEKVLVATKNMLDIHEMVGKLQKKESQSTDPYAPLQLVIAVMERELQSAKLPPEQCELIAYRVVRVLLENPSGAGAFVKKLEEAK